MTDPAKRERAALDVLALLPEWWAVGPTSYDPGVGRWSYTARGQYPGRGKHPETITGTGEDQLAAMIDLRIRLDERCGFRERACRHPRSRTSKGSISARRNWVDARDAFRNTMRVQFGQPPLVEPPAFGE